MTKGTRDWQRFDGLIAIEFKDLLVNYRTLEALGFPRVPLWHEIHDAISGAIEGARGRKVEFGSLSVPETGGGQCLFHAGVTAALLSLLTTEKVGAVAGGVMLSSRSKPGMIYAMPRNLYPPTKEGGYHAWNGLSHDGAFYFIDMSYHWIAKANPDIAGPDSFVVADVAMLDYFGIGYYAHEPFTRLVAPAMSPSNLNFLVEDALRRIKSALSPAAVS